MKPGWTKLQLRAASGTLTAAETTSALIPLGGASYNEAVVVINSTVISAGTNDQIDYYVQTSYDETNWVDLANVHYANADNGTTPIQVVVLPPPSQRSSTITTTDGTLTDDTVAVGLPLGVKVRIRTAITSSPGYAYSAMALFREAGVGAVTPGVDIGDVDVLSIAAGDTNIGNVDIASIAAGTTEIGRIHVSTASAPLVAGTAEIGRIHVSTLSASIPAGTAEIGRIHVSTLSAPLVAGTAEIGRIHVSTFSASIPAGIAEIGRIHLSTLSAPLVAGTAEIGRIHVSTFSASIPAGTSEIGRIHVSTLSAPLVAGTAEIGRIHVSTSSAALPAGTAEIGRVHVSTISAGTQRVGGTYEVGGTLIDENGTALSLTRVTANIVASATDSLLVASTAAVAVRVHAFAANVGAGGGGITLRTMTSGTGSAIGPVWLFGANGGIVLPHNPHGWFETSVGDALTINTSAGSTVGMQFSYTIPA